LTGPGVKRQQALCYCTESVQHTRIYCESKRCTADVNGHFCRLAVVFTLANDLPHDFADKGVLSVLVAEFYQSDICRFKATTVALTLGCKLAGCYHF